MDYEKLNKNYDKIGIIYTLLIFFPYFYIGHDMTPVDVYYDAKNKAIKVYKYFNEKDQNESN